MSQVGNHTIGHHSGDDNLSASINSNQFGAGTISIG